MAARTGLAVNALSRATGRGEGMVVGGRVMLRMAPQLVSELAGDRVAALVSATNGKTSTTRLLAHAVEQNGPVVTQPTGANMTTGVAVALAQGDPTGQAVLEVDEAYLPGLLPQLRPRVVILGNLSRDQLDRMNEVGMVARKWRRMLATPQARDGRLTIIANADDPMVVWSAIDFPNVIWVGAGQAWTSDSAVCLECGSLLAREEAGSGWHCPSCGLARPETSWELVWDAERSIGHAESAELPHPMELAIQLPGRFNASNAILALAAAVHLGLDAERSIDGMAAVSAVSGRYAVVQVGALRIRLLLAKNPAGWSELVDVMPPAPAPVIVTINSNAADGRDPSWLWDVPFERLRGRTVIASGDRRRDLAVRLLQADVDHVVVEDPYAPDAQLPSGTRELDVVDCAATYTAFHALRTRADAQARQNGARS